MTDIQALNSETHRDLRVTTERGAEYGEDIHIVPIVADELRNLVLEYPVILVKDPDSGKFELCAMLGFEQGENLFLRGNDWNATYVPIHIRRRPFSLSYTAEKDGELDPQSLVVSIDMASNRIGKEDGEVLFNEDGSRSEFLQQISLMLSGLGAAVGATSAFINALLENDLVEPSQLNVQFAEGKTKRFDGLYAVSDEKLEKLDGDVLADLYKSGYLQAAWLMLASIGNMRKLLALRAKRDQA